MAISVYLQWAQADATAYRAKEKQNIFHVSPVEIQRLYRAEAMARSGDTLLTIELYDI